MRVVTTGVVVDPIAVTDVEAVLRAIPPDRALHEPRERRRECRIELPRINVRGNQIDNGRTAAWPVAGQAIGVVCPEPVQAPGPVQEVVHQCIDRDHAAADFEPAAPTAWGAPRNR